MAIALVTHTISQNTSNPNTTSAVDTTGANLIVICVMQDGATYNTPTDSKSNTWTQLHQLFQAGWFYCLSPTVGSGHTFSQNNSAGGGGTVSGICVMAFSGVSALETSTATDTSFQAGSITPANANSLLVAAWVSSASNAGTLAIDQSFTILDSPSRFGAAALAYLIETTATAKNPTWSGLDDVANTRFSGLASFTPAAGASFQAAWAVSGQQSTGTGVL